MWMYFFHALTCTWNVSKGISSVKVILQQCPGIKTGSYVIKVLLLYLDPGRIMRKMNVIAWRRLLTWTMLTT